jgi:hypothetical protein
MPPNLAPLPHQLAVEERRLLLLAGCLFPLRRASIPNPAKGGRGGPVPVSAYIIRESIKWRVKEVDGTALLHDVAPDLADIHARLGAAAGGGDAGSSGTGEGMEARQRDVRVALGHAIRRLRQHWRLGALLAPLVRHPACAAPLGVEDVDGRAGTPASSGGSGGGGAPDAAAGAGGGEEAAAAEWAAGQVGMVKDLLAAAAAFGLEDCWQWKPLLDGKEVRAPRSRGGGRGEPAGPPLWDIRALAAGAGVSRW